MDIYDKAYQDFYNRRMKPRGLKMTEDTMATMTDEQKEAVLKEAGDLYQEGKKDEAFDLVREKLGDEAAAEVAAVLASVEAYRAQVAEAQAAEEATETAEEVEA